MRNVAVTIGRFESVVPTGTTIEERLINAAATLLHWVLVNDTVDICRMGISEACRFPELATSVHCMARERGEDTIRRVLSEVAQSDEREALPAFRPEQLAATTHFFVDLVVMPMVLRALFGEKRKSLQAEIGPHAARSVAFFLAARRNGFKLNPLQASNLLQRHNDAFGPSRHFVAKQQSVAFGGNADID
jgi:hypothetical protein